MINVNLLGPINVCKVDLPIMKKNHTNLTININSQAGINHKAERTVYNASKWGTGFTKSLKMKFQNMEFALLMLCLV